jgi:CBS domain-containing protein
MTMGKTNFPTVSPNADLFGEWYRLLQQSGLKALPVVEGSKLVGMLTLEDVGHASLLGQPTTRR